MVRRWRVHDNVRALRLPVLCGRQSCQYLLGQQPTQFLLGVAQAALDGFQRCFGEGGDLRQVEIAVGAQQEHFALVGGQGLAGRLRGAGCRGSGSAVARDRRRHRSGRGSVRHSCRARGCGCRVCASDRSGGCGQSGRARYENSPGLVADWCCGSGSARCPGRPLRPVRLCRSSPAGSGTRPWRWRAYKISNAGAVARAIAGQQRFVAAGVGAACRRRHVS